LLKGERLTGGEKVDTKNALGIVNGHQIQASPAEIEALKEHIRTYQSLAKDLRKKMRKVEHQLLEEHAGFLIGNQCLDFQKQDGVTEIEESIMANAVERRLNDLLLREEAAGRVVVNRKPIYVSAVSNFTNFLDLFRKTVRSLEVGVPVIVLSRSNTSQHSYRWAQLLLELSKQADVDPGMITFLSCSLDDIRDITSSCREYTGNLYATCSRQLAAEIKASYPNTVASTGGPNTLVCTDAARKKTDEKETPVLTDALKRAIACSASIESSGQCTALRHCVVPPSVTVGDLEHVFDCVHEIADAPKALKDSMFDGVFAKHEGTVSPDKADSSYKKLESVDVYVRVNEDLPAAGINEFWRKVVVDFSKKDLHDEEQVNQLAAWLNENQPISLAVNGPRQDAMRLARQLFDKTSLVVNTVGSTDDPDMPPALSCQARPQEAEIFGEFPPRSSMTKYTKFPVVVPSSNPSYDAVYTEDFLRSKGALHNFFIKSTKALLEEVQNIVVRGYCVVLIEYLQDVDKLNPKLGYGKSRTVIWGLLRPPLEQKTVIHCGAGVSWDDVAPIYILFHATTARPQIELSIDPKNEALIKLCQEHKLSHSAETEQAFTTRLTGRKDVFHAVNLTEPLAQKTFPMAGNFVSLYLPLGHIKGTKPSDEEFEITAKFSNKWLSTLF
jgi:hypothetical protein